MSLGLACTALGSGCRRTTDLPSQCDGLGGGGDGENILLIVSDDVGTDKTAVYAENPNPARTPNIDALAAEGVLFRNAYAQPTCSPSRASLLTGRQPTRTGIGRWIYSVGSDIALADDEVLIPAMLELSPHDYASALAGKWHLVGFDAPDAADDPTRRGFDCHAGSLSNPLEAMSGGHFPRSFTRWEKDVDGELDWTRTYMTTDTTDEALARIANLRQPWFLEVAYNDAHTPYHRPPRRLLTQRVGRRASKQEMYEAQIEALDTEIGRLLAGIPPDIRANTTIIYLTDNGTPSSGVRPPQLPERSKGTVFDGGVRVPLIITGPHVAYPGSESDALVHIVDIFPTVAELAEVDLSTQTQALDGFSLLPYLEDPDTPSAREVVFAEDFYPNGLDPAVQHERMVRDAEWKVVRFGGHEELYHYLPGAVDEGIDLMEAGPLDAEAEAAHNRLAVALDAIVRELESEDGAGG